MQRKKIIKKINSTDDDNEVVLNKNYQKSKRSLSLHWKIQRSYSFNLRYETPKEIPAVFHNCSTYDCHFIIKQLPKELEGQLEWL